MVDNTSQAIPKPSSLKNEAGTVHCTTRGVAATMTGDELTFAAIAGVCWMGSRSEVGQASTSIASIIG